MLRSWAQESSPVLRVFSRQSGHAGVVLERKLPGAGTRPETVGASGHSWERQQISGWRFSVSRTGPSSRIDSALTSRCGGSENNPRLPSPPEPPTTDRRHRAPTPNPRKNVRRSADRRHEPGAVANDRADNEPASPPSRTEPPGNDSQSDATATPATGRTYHSAPK